MTDFFFLTTFYSGGRLVARSTPRHACLIIPLLNLLLTALLLARHHHTGRALLDFDSGDYGMLLTLNICSWPFPVWHLRHPEEPKLSLRETTLLLIVLLLGSCGLIAGLIWQWG